MTETYFYEPLKGHGLPHDPFKAILTPRPIGWISTVDAQGRVNLAPYSFFAAIATFPPMVCFSSDVKKDTVRNAEATGEFVYNLATRDLAWAMNETCAPLPPGENEMTRAGLAAAPSRLVKPPRVATTPAAFECKVTQVIQLTGADGEARDNWMVIGQVMGVHIDPAFLKNGRFDTIAARPIARCGYRGDYAEVSELFEMLRPTA